MGIPNIMITGKSGLMTSRAAIATTGHNISNASTEGYSRQRVVSEVLDPSGQPYSKNRIGTGTTVSRVERINDEYVEKQLRNGSRDLSYHEEKDMILKQTEDIFNEMNGEGLNRLVAKFFNDFRKLSEEPENEAIRQSVRESTNALCHDIHRLRGEVIDVRNHIDSRIEGHVAEVNALADQVRVLNMKIMQLEAEGGSPNDLLDKRDLALKRLGSFLDVSMHKDKNGSYLVDIRDVGPLVAGPNAENLSVHRSPADDRGKAENALDVMTSASANGIVTHQIKGGKLGGLLDARDKMLSTVLDRLDELAYALTTSVNKIHAQGVTPMGEQGVIFFRDLDTKDRASEFIELSDDIKADVNNIATAAMPDAPGDNRVAIAIAQLQSQRVMSHGNSTFDDWYNSIVSDVGVASAKNKFSLNQQRDIMTQLGKVREQISGVSIDEETTNLLQYQHVFDASAKVIQVADEMLKTVLELKR